MLAFLAGREVVSSSIKIRLPRFGFLVRRVVGHATIKPNEFLLALLRREFHDREMISFMILVAMQVIGAQPAFIRNYVRKRSAQLVCQIQNYLKRVMLVDQGFRRFAA